ncbi:hypothetical protein [Treponema pedis]|uniref:Uncharacterized protein n=2 Tax=Treponema pedis TaxID=409322 RepID=S6A4Q3_9SPIR|nr:hypothetical protein [Treponema pedis]AGT44656.1 hypothetical protein TPE_2182 [Treponema pedis str. T A4]QOW59981.1 hypothetical protein IFE08_08960 [Treponema pedis]
MNKVRNGGFLKTGCFNGCRGVVWAVFCTCGVQNLTIKKLDDEFNSVLSI